MMDEFDTMEARGKFIRLHEAANRSMRTEFAVDEFEDNFDELFERVENGETLTIVHSDGHKVFMVPYDKIENV